MTVELTPRQTRVLDTLLELPVSGHVTEAKLFASVWRLEALELELLMDSGLVEYFRRGGGRVWWLSARGRRYAQALRESRETTANDTDRRGAASVALQGAGDHAPPTEPAERPAP